MPPYAIKLLNVEGLKIVFPRLNYGWTNVDGLYVGTSDSHFEPVDRLENIHVFPSHEAAQKALKYCKWNDVDWKPVIVKLTLVAEPV